MSTIPPHNPPSPVPATSRFLLWFHKILGPPNHKPKKTYLSLCITTIYLVAFLGLLSLVTYRLLAASQLPDWLRHLKLFSFCTIMGGCGGIFYALWAVYTHWCKLKDWDDDWLIWYLIRPILALMGGAFTYLLLKSGLLLLQPQSAGVPNELNVSENMGYLVFAFLAGFNIENLSKKFTQLFATFFNISDVTKDAHKAQADADKAQADADKAQSDADNALAVASLAQAEADKVPSATDKAKAAKDLRVVADKAQAYADTAKAYADKAKAYAETLQASK